MPEVELLPDLGLVAAAGFLLLIAAALWVLQELIRQSFGRIPVIGSWVQSNINDVLNTARLAILALAAESWVAAVNLFHWLQNWLWRMLIGFVLWAFQASQTVAHIATVQIPQLEQRVEVVALGWINSAVAAAEQTFNAVIATVRADVAAADRAIVTAENTVTAYATSLYDRAVTDIRAAIITAETWAASQVVALDTELTAELVNLRAEVAADLATAESLAAGLFRTAEADITREVAGAEALAFAQVQALQRGIYTDLENWGDQALNLAWPDAIPDLQALRDTLGADFPWLNDLIGALLGLGAAGLLGALIRALAGTQAITRLANDCIVPTCRNLSGLGSDLAQLAQAFNAGLIFAWLAEGAVNPSGWAADTAAVLGTVGNDTITAAKSVLGV